MEIPELKGLTEEEVIQSRNKYGSNTIEHKKQNRFLQVIKEIAFEPLFLILVCTAVIYFIFGEYKEGIIMLIALGFVSGISLYQENRSRNAVDALKKLSSPLAKVIRSRKISEIPSEEIVINDLIIAEDGGIVPADATILESHDFSVNESILTGEALPVFKDSKGSGNNLFEGTMTTSGSCIAQVTAIGKNTTLGKIGQTLQNIEVTKTPLQNQIKRFVTYMVIAGSAAFVIVFAVNIYLSGDIFHSLLHGLTLAMSALPEEIPVAFSTFMALGAYHLYKKKVITKSPYTVETLGAATVICTDKTGTITENEMQLAVIYDFDQGKSYDYMKETPKFNPVLEYSMWASETSPFDMMEKSIHRAYELTAKPDKRPEYQMIHEYPLSGKPPIMTHVFSDKKMNQIIACKGSVEGVLKQCKLAPAKKEIINNKTSEFASKGFRVLAVAKSNHNINKLPVSQHDFEFEFIGLIAFYDPPKKNIEIVLQSFYDAGINVKMITGDYSETALSLADQIHLKNSTKVLTGNEVMACSQNQLREKVKDINVYARMFPDAKLKIIEALKANGEVVAMTGDGVNDGPALKASHIGIAMGMRGSEIAKNVASLILMDDDLKHMVDAVAIGRRIYENLKKAIQYIISIHIPIIMIVTLPLLFFWKYTEFFSPVHVIFLELIMGPTCSIIFEREPIESGSMKKGPRALTSTFFSFHELSMSIIQGLVITTACLGLGYYSMIQNNSEPHIRALIFTVLIFSNLFLTLVNRSFYSSVLKTMRHKNNLIPVIFLISLFILFLSLYLEPVRNIFQFEQLTAIDLLVCLAVSFAGVIWVEFYKLLKRKRVVK